MTILRNFSYKDISDLQQHGYAQYSKDNLEALIDSWNSKTYDGAYFEMFAVCNETATLGYASLYQRSKSIVNCGIEIYPDYQSKGYGYDAYSKLICRAKDLGFKIAVAQVLKDNIASIALHIKLGFEAEEYEYLNKEGKKVYYFIKIL